MKSCQGVTYMKEEKIRKKYPNIKTEEEYEKLCKMLKYKNNEIIATLCACALVLLGAILYTLNLIITFTCLIAGFVLRVIGVACWGRHIDEFFLATARRKKVENRTVLNQETVQKALKKSVIKELGFDLLASILVVFFCMVVWGFCLIGLDEGDTEIPVLVFFVIIPLMTFGIIRISTIIKRRITKNTEYILLCSKILSKNAVNSSDPESSSESYYFTFNCADYGKLDYEIDSNRYHTAFVGKDEYYMIVVKKRFSKKYQIVGIFSTEEYELSHALEKNIRVI